MMDPDEAPFWVWVTIVWVCNGSWQNPRIALSDRRLGVTL